MTDRRRDVVIQVAVGTVICAVIALLDVVAGTTVILIPLLVVAPLVVSTQGTRPGVLLVATIATAVAVGLGWVDRIAGSQRHAVGIVTTALGGVLALVLVSRRDAQVRRLDATVPVIRAADRLRAALATGRMGEWTWNAATGRITGDEVVAALVGDPGVGTVEMTLADWLDRVDQRDVDLVRARLTAPRAMEETFRFDHRCTWPDGSIHWIEVIGELTSDAGNERVSGAFGLAVDVDELHREIDERTRLLEFERDQRRRSEYFAAVNDVLVQSLDIDEIVRHVTATLIPELADWCSIVVSIDRPRSSPTITVAHGDPGKVRWAERLLTEHPYDPDARSGAARVIRSGSTEFIPNVRPDAIEGEAGDVLRAAGVSSVLTVPLVGALGTLGAMQLIRDSDRPAFSAPDRDLVEELAGRAGTALNNAVLFQRQRRGLAALEVLQQVSGHIASAATTDAVIKAALHRGSQGVNAFSAAMITVGPSGDTTVEEFVPNGRRSSPESQLATARRAIDESRVVEETTDESLQVGVPLRILHRTLGAIVFDLEPDRQLAAEELSMLATLGSRCAGALERASLYERERNIALTLQHRLLSRLPETPRWVEAAASYVPASGLEIGGDWYQILDAGEGRIAAIVGDAVGHGLGSAAAMGQLRASIATAVANDPDPTTALSAVDSFAGRGSDTLGASVAYVLLAPDGSGAYASAGHLPVVHMPAGEPARFLEHRGGSLLGFSRPRPTPYTRLRFAPGDIVVLYTDGLVERRGELLDHSMERLLRAVEASRHQPLQELCDGLIQTLTGDREPSDDIAVLLLRAVAG